MTPETRIRQIQQFIGRMPSLSTTVTKVLEVCNSPSTSPHDLNRVISLDPVLTGQMLKLINSAYYGVANRITSLTRAIIMLGVNTVKNMVLATSVLGSFKVNAGLSRQAIDQYWTHCLGVGVAAKAIARFKNVPAIEQEEYFVGGLLHDLGKLPIMACFPDAYELAINRAEAEQVPFYRMEVTDFGFDHCIAGRLIVAKWKLGAGIGDAVVRHHDPVLSKMAPNFLFDTICLANQTVHLLQLQGTARLGGDRKLTRYLAQRCKVDPEVIFSLKETIEIEIQKAMIFLQVAKG
jgi:HD-like signal output (HDOD) protein